MTKYETIKQELDALIKSKAPAKVVLVKISELHAQEISDAIDEEVLKNMPR